MMDSFTKQPSEAFTVSVDFSKNFASRETISTQTVSVLNADEVNVTTTITNQATLANDGRSKVSILVRAGNEDESPYKLTFGCVTSNGHIWEHDIQMIIESL